MLFIRSRLFTLVSIFIIVSLGLYADYYRGSENFWLNNSLAGLFYEIFWCLCFFFIFPRSKPWKIVFYIFVVTCILEILQLWHPLFLEKARNTWLGRSILGSSFNPIDFVYYIVGSLLGGLWIMGIRKWLRT